MVGTLDASESVQIYRKRRLRLSLATAHSLIRHPSLFSGLLDRYFATRDETKSGKYIVSSGPRCIYYGVVPSTAANTSAST